MSVEPPLKIYSLPLFPLHHVLFPQFPLQLHIFEERYRVMINNCIERNEPFGVVLIREGSEVGTPAVPYEVGCVARILAVKRLEDGRIHLLAVGESRFRLLDYVEADLPYLIGRVEEVADAPTRGRGLTASARQLSELFQQYLQLLAQRTQQELPELDLPDEPGLLSFCIAYITQLPPLVKQRLLELTDTRERVRQEVALLREQIAELEATPVDESEPQEASEITVMIARPIDSEAEHWRSFIHESRN